MFVSNSTLESLASRFVVGRKALEEATQASYSAFVPTTTQAAAATLSSGSNNSASQDSSQDNSAYNESFARMMLSLKTQAQASLSTGVADSDNGVTSESQASAVQGSNFSTTQQAFLDYMAQPATERLREQMTGVSAEEYAAMSPDEQKAVDQKFQDALKRQQEVAQEDINTRIRALKAGMIA